MKRYRCAVALPSGPPPDGEAEHLLKPFGSTLADRAEILARIEGGRVARAAPRRTAPAPPSPPAAVRRTSSVQFAS